MEKGETYEPPPNRPFYSKNLDKVIYDQMNMIITKFSTMDTLKESIHSYDTQKCEALNQCIARVVPKFKHFGATLTLQTRIHLVVGIANEGYSKFYGTILPQLVNLKMHNNHIVNKGIQQIEKLRTKNRHRKVSTDFKRSRKHKTKAKIKEQVYEDRVSKKNNYSTYESGFNFQTETEKENQSTIITEGETGQTNEKTKCKEKEKKKSNGTNKNNRFCKWCDKLTNHTTWVSKNCIKHNDWLSIQKKKNRKQKKMVLTNENEKETIQQQRDNNVSDTANVDIVNGDDKRRSGDDDGRFSEDLLCVVIDNDTKYKINENVE